MRSQTIALKTRLLLFHRVLALIGFQFPFNGNAFSDGKGTKRATNWRQLQQLPNADVIQMCNWTKTTFGKNKQGPYNFNRYCPVIANNTLDRYRTAILGTLWYCCLNERLRSIQRLRFEARNWCESESSHNGADVSHHNSQLETSRQPRKKQAPIQTRFVWKASFTRFRHIWLKKRDSLATSEKIVVFAE